MQEYILIHPTGVPVAALSNAPPQTGILGCFRLGVAATPGGKEIEQTDPCSKGRASSNLYRKDRGRIEQSKFGRANAIAEALEFRSQR